MQRRIGVARVMTAGVESMNFGLLFRADTVELRLQPASLRTLCGHGVFCGEFSSDKFTAEHAESTRENQERREGGWNIRQAYPRRIPPETSIVAASFLLSPGLSHALSLVINSKVVRFPQSDGKLSARR